MRLLLSLTCLLVLAACQKGAKDGDKQNSDTTSFSYRIAELEEKIQASPEDYRLYEERAELYYENDSFQLAVKDVEKAISLADTSAHLHFLRGFFAMSKNDTTTAKKYFQNALLRQNKDPEVPYQLAQIAIQGGNYSQAVQWVEEAYKMDSLTAQYVFAKGFIAQKTQNLPEAIRFYTRSIALDSSFAKAYTQLHDLYLIDKKEEKEALKWNDLLLKKNPEHPLAKFNQARSLYRQAETAKGEERKKKLAFAVVAYSDAIHADSLFKQAIYERGYAYFMLENEEPAIKDFERVVSLDPLNDRAWFMLGSIYEHYQDKSAALEYYRKALKVNPDFADAAAAVKELSGR